ATRHAPGGRGACRCRSRQLGPTVACGAGGVLVELVKDVSIRLTPLTAADAAGMLRELRSFPLLTGYRGGPPCAVSALEDVLLWIGALADDHPTIPKWIATRSSSHRQGQLSWMRASVWKERHRCVRSARVPDRFAFGEGVPACFAH